MHARARGGSMSRELALRGRIAQVMLAMRPSPITVESLEERYVSYPAYQINRLLAEGLVERCLYLGQAAYRLTELGRQKCPSRRALHAAADTIIAAQEAKEARWHSWSKRASA